jgi:hypothetical protein
LLALTLPTITLLFRTADAAMSAGRRGPGVVALA